MNLTVLENHFLIDLAHEDLLKALKGTSSIFDKGKVLYNINIDDSFSYFYKEVDIYYSKLHELWFSYYNHEGRYLFAFGLNEPKKDDSNTPICVFDFPKKNIEENALAVFSRDKKGKIFILHRGTIQGIDSEINTKFKDKIMEVEEGEGKSNLIFISALNDLDIMNKFKEFVIGIDDIISKKRPKEAENGKTNEYIEYIKINSEPIKENLPTNLDPENNDEDEIALVLKGIKEIKKHITINLFDKKVLYNAMDPPLVDTYLNLLLKHDLVKEIRPSTYLLQRDSELKKFEGKYNESMNEDTSMKLNTKTKATKECIICKQDLPLSKFFKTTDFEDGLSPKCKDCSRKVYAVKSLNELAKVVDIDSRFYKKDLLKMVENRMRYLDYIWTLQEFNLLEHDEKSDSYTFKPEKVLDEFIEKYQDPSVKEKYSASSQKTKKITKTCACCNKSLSISKFYKSSDSEDGLSEKCKECTDKINAAKMLTEIQNFVKINDSFSKNELLERIESPAMIDSYIWTLQEHDLIKYDEKSDVYRINENKILDYAPFLPKVGKSEEDTRKGPEQPTEEVETGIPVKEVPILCKKEIIYISDNNGNSNRNLILKGLVRKEDIFSTIQGIQSIILDQNKILISKFNDNLSDIMMELEIKNESLESVLNLLEDAEWENRVILNKNEVVKS